MEYAIELKELTKRFNQVYGQRQDLFSGGKGEIHALAGENGAGKTTLMNMIYGLYTPTSGELWINGEQVKLPAPAIPSPGALAWCISISCWFQSLR